MSEKKHEKTEEIPILKYSKDQILKAIRYQNQRDLLFALLENGKQYTSADVEALINNFLKGKVK